MQTTTPMLYHHSYYCVSPLPLLNVISFTTTTVSTTSASLDHSYILDHCFFGSPLFVWTTTTSLDCDDIFGLPLYLRIKKAVCDRNFRFFIIILTYSSCGNVGLIFFETKKGFILGKESLHLWGIKPST